MPKAIEVKSMEYESEGTPTRCDSGRDATCGADTIFSRRGKTSLPLL